jgi:hypothetical protein
MAGLRGLPARRITDRWGSSKRWTPVQSCFQQRSFNNGAGQMTPARLDFWRGQQRGPQLRSRQRGLTMFGLLFWGMTIGFVAYLLVRILPTVNEYSTILRTVGTIAQSQPSTVAQARQAFDRQKDLEYAISSISGKDLVITKENDKVVISFAYDNAIPIYGPVYVLIKYSGSSR